MRRKTTLRQSLCLTYPDLAPLAGVFLVLNCILLLIYFPKEPKLGLVSSEETPYRTGNACFYTSIGTETIISLTADGRVSFAVTDTTLQTAIFKQVGKRHGITFTTSQLADLRTLPYLATTIEQLPEMATYSPSAYQAQIAAQRYNSLNLLQLAECAGTAKLLASSLTGYPTSFFLSISAEADASRVIEIIGLLHNQGINYFYLLAHSN